MKDWIWAYCGALYLVVALMAMVHWETNREHARRIDELERKVSKLTEQVEALEKRVAELEGKR